MKDIGKIIIYVFPYWKSALLNIVFNVLSVIFSLVSLTMVIPFLGILFGTVNLVYEEPSLRLSTSSVIDYFYWIISKIIINFGKVEALLFICIMVVVLFFLKNLFRYLAQYYMAVVRNGVLFDFREKIFSKILELPLAYYTDRRKGDIISRITNDVTELEWSVMSSLEILFREPFALMLFLITLIVMSPQLSLFAFMTLPISVFIIGSISKTLKETSRKGQAKAGYMLSQVEETISSLRIIKAFQAEKWIADKFTSSNQSLRRLMIKMYRKRDLASPLSEFLGAVVLVTIMWFGGKLVLDKSSGVTAEVFIAYVAVFSQMMRPAQAFSQAFYNVQKGRASLERINEILKHQNTIKEKENPIVINDFKNEIEYKNVSFYYENNNEVLHNINLKIKKGKTVAIVGSSGSGKSTIMDLLARFHDVTDGCIMIDGVDIRDISLPSLRSLMGIVTQETILFHDTVYNNIAFGRKDVTFEDVVNAAKIANAHEFIVNLSDGYYTIIGDRGCKLSGGQKQRISIARAILKNPPILLLDEATSSLDTESEKLVQESLNKLMENRTSIIVAHRLSTVRNADIIYVIHKGTIVEQGTHEELYENKGIYRKLCDLQMFAE